MLSSIVARLANKLQRRLLAQQNRAWTFDLEEGVLDTARLTRIITDPTSPLSFKAESESPFRDTVVTLLLDNSGSMAGSKIRDLQDAAIEREREATEALLRVHPEHLDSARNLLHYAALRQVDLRPLQARLSQLGLSSLGRAEARVLENLDFSLPPGGIVGVIGPNGAGKTTLFRMITGQEEPDAGTFRVGDTVDLAYVDQSRDTLDADLRWRDPETHAGLAEIRALRDQILSTYVGAPAGTALIDVDRRHTDAELWGVIFSFWRLMPNELGAAKADDLRQSDLLVGRSAWLEKGSPMAEILATFRPGRGSWLAPILGRRIDAQSRRPLLRSLPPADGRGRPGRPRGARRGARRARRGGSRRARLIRPRAQGRRRVARSWCAGSPSGRWLRTGATRAA